MAENRDEYIKVYLTDFEKEKIKRKAKKESMSVSTFARRKILRESEE